MTTNNTDDDDYLWVRDLLLMGGRMTIGYVIADQICQHSLGSSLSAIMPNIDDGGATATVVALYTADMGIRQAIHAVKEKLSIFDKPKRGLPNEATARLEGGLDGVWLVSGFESGEIVTMTQAEFGKFERELAKANRGLVKIVPSSISSRELEGTFKMDDGTIRYPTVTTMRYKGGKLHSDDGPAISLTERDGTILRSKWFLSGNQVTENEHKKAMFDVAFGDGNDDGKCRVSYPC